MDVDIFTVEVEGDGARCQGDGVSEEEFVVVVSEAGFELDDAGVDRKAWGEDDPGDFEVGLDQRFDKNRGEPGVFEQDRSEMKRRIAPEEICDPQRCSDTDDELLRIECVGQSNPDGQKEKCFADHEASLGKNKKSSLCGAA